MCVLVVLRPPLPRSPPASLSPSVCVGMFGEWQRAVNPAHTCKYLGKNVQIRIPILSAHLPQNEDLEDKPPVAVAVAVALLRPANYLFGLVLKCGSGS